MNKKSSIGVLLLVCSVLINTWSPVYSQTTSEQETKAVIYERKAEIYTNYLVMKSKETSESDLYLIQPKSSSPYVAGQLKTSVLESALARTNFMRSLAYLSSNVVLDDSWNMMAQHAAVVNAANGSLSHDPVQKSNMSDSFYQLGYEGSNTSNLYMGFLSLDETVMKYLYDSDERNISHLGHRRWLLNPAMTKVGFGYLNTNGPNAVYSAMKVFGGNTNAISLYNRTYDYVAWPSQNAFPMEYFADDEAWSVVLNHKIYDMNRTNQIKVTLTNVTTGVTKTFSKSKADGYFNVETSYFGTPYCIIFKPEDFSYTQGSQYKVLITGLYDLNGKTRSVSYTTDFFSIEAFQTTFEENTDFANKLFEMGVFKGTKNGFELDRRPTRLEGLVMLVRLLGKEAAAMAMKEAPCVFTDVPDWGRGYVNYAYQFGLTKGVGADLFGSDEKIEAMAYATFMLRALGYSDQAGDFKWNESLAKGKDLGMISKVRFDGLLNGVFVRGDVAAMSYSTLHCQMKSGGKTLIEELVDSGSIDVK